MEMLELITDGFSHEELMFYGSLLIFISLGLITVTTLAVIYFKEALND